MTEARSVPRFGTRAATDDDIDLIHCELMNVIDESPHYNAEFKNWEKARLTKSYLRMLQRQDPWHVIALLSEGKVGGALISGPEFGAIFRYWSWIFPAFRQTRLGMHGMRAFDEHFDHGRFHKAYTFVRPENEVAFALLRRYGYEQTALLRQHIFGQDYCVLEKPYTKVVDGYDTGVGTGRLGRAVQRINELLGR
ncbi:MAG TPA: GNAT family protein [Devosia sp.]|nr:GNAT family protein [Devosia sp.]